MSQIDNKVKWCLNKAKKELGEGTKHRGLVKINPDIEGAKSHILKAEHNFKAVISFDKTGFSDWAVSAAFYTMYHCFLAIVLKFGYESRNQDCTIALVENLREQKLIEIDPSIIEALKESENEEMHERSAIELRENFQYGILTKIDDNELSKLKDLCKIAIEEAKRIIYQ